jgi:hypothetical protein
MMRSLFSCMTDHNTHHMTKANFHTSHIHGNAYDIPQIHSPPTDKILWRSYQVVKLQEVQAGTLKTSAERCCGITTGCPIVDYYETGGTSSMDE